MGVDNVDVDAATRQGVVVANAPQSNVVTAAEHTMALLLALARNVPQAHGSLVAGRWDRSKFTGVEVHDKVLGIIGFGRIGQLVAHRARGFGMRVVAFDAYMAEERFAELGVERAASAEAVYAVADFITVHLPKNAETQDFLDAKAFAAMKDGVRILNVARGPLVVDEALKDALDSGKVAGAALDVFREEPITEHPLFGYPNVVVTPHLGASTTEATDRAGFQAAEQVVAALTGAPVTTAVNVPAISADDVLAVEPFLGLCLSLGRIAAGLAPATSLEALEIEFLGRVAERDHRLLTIQVVKGALQDHTEEDVNDVNALTLAAERGIAVSTTSRPVARDFTDLVRVTIRGGTEDHPRRRHGARAAASPAPARGLGLALQRAARTASRGVPLPRPARDARTHRHRVRRRGHQHRLRRRRPSRRRRERRGRRDRHSRRTGSLVRARLDDGDRRLLRRPRHQPLRARLSPRGGTAPALLR